MRKTSDFFGRAPLDLSCLFSQLISYLLAKMSVGPVYLIFEPLPRPISFQLAALWPCYGIFTIFMGFLRNFV